ncbi:MAG TPA: tripartite tricarboxylate transporter substrate-binding protein [Xanthobacteraceae bacterium]|nr:tripartite tricarboxylate transporter substrate-binding protein [Xanthobacteraceae bacterium]
MRIGNLVRGTVAAAVLAVVPATMASAQSPAEFYKGKTVDMMVGYSAGGGYDVYARMVARYIGKHIPGNPTVVVKNLEGAGSLRLANALYNALPKDGTVLGTIARGGAFDPLLGNKAAQFDASKFNWIGSANDEVSVCVAWHTSGITKIEDTFNKELVVGGTGPSADTDQFPRIVNGVLGTKMKIVSGYPGGNDVSLAMERGEVQGRCGWSWSSVLATRKDWYDTKKINVLVQMSLQKHPDLPNVPLVIDLANTPEEKQILTLVFARQALGRPFLAPPGIPQDRVDALRKAFMDTMKDPEFLAEAEKAKLEVNPISGEEVQKIVVEAYKVDPAIAKKTEELLKVKN